MNAIAARITGMQHIGLPTNDIEATIAFYEKLGFEVASTCDLPTDKVAFLKLKNIRNRLKGRRILLKLTNNLLRKKKTNHIIVYSIGIILSFLYSIVMS